MVVITTGLIFGERVTFGSNVWRKGTSATAATAADRLICVLALIITVNVSVGGCLL